MYTKLDENKSPLVSRDMSKVFGVNAETVSRSPTSCLSELTDETELCDDEEYQEDFVGDVTVGQRSD